MNSKNNNSKAQAKAPKKIAIVSDSVGSYETHPFFVKKGTAAKALLLKVGLPKELEKKKHA